MVLQYVMKLQNGWRMTSHSLLQKGVYVYTFYLEGAGWDHRNCKLIDSKPKVLFEMMPVVRMYACGNMFFFFFFITLCSILLKVQRNKNAKIYCASQAETANIW